MPPGHTTAKPPAKVVERVTALAALDIARSIQRIRIQAGDQAGSDAAELIAASIESELLRS